MSPVRSPWGSITVTPMGEAARAPTRLSSSVLLPEPVDPNTARWRARASAPIARSRPRLVPRTRRAGAAISGGGAPSGRARMNPAPSNAASGSDQSWASSQSARRVATGCAEPRWMRHSIAWTPSSSEPVKPISRHSSASAASARTPDTPSARETSKPTIPLRRRASASRSAGVRRAGRPGAGSVVGRSRMASATVRARKPAMDWDPPAPPASRRHRDGGTGRAWIRRRTSAAGTAWSRAAARARTGRASAASTSRSGHPAGPVSRPTATATGAGSRSVERSSATPGYSARRAEGASAAP